MTTTLLAHRYFFAALPDQVTASRNRAWAERVLGPQGLLEAKRLHTTLGITDDFAVPRPDLVRAMLRAGDRVTAPAHDLVLDRLSIGSKSIALRPGHRQQGLIALYTDIADRMAAEGAPMREGWNCNPHMTLGYRRSPPSTRPVRDRGWRVSEFVLIHSLVGLTRHEVLGRWSLGADPQLSLFG